jgi:hypothetical protein
MQNYIDQEQFQKDKLKFAISACEDILKDDSCRFTDQAFTHCVNRLEKVGQFDRMHGEPVYYVRCLYFLLAYNRGIWPVLKVIKSSVDSRILLILCLSNTQILYAEKEHVENIKIEAFEAWDYPGILGKLIKRAFGAIVIDDERV